MEFSVGASASFRYPFLVYNQYFFSRYQKEVLERYQTEINNLDMEIVNHVQWMRTIAGQLANLQTCQYDNIREDAPNYSGIINTFISIVSPQKFFLLWLFTVIPFRIPYLPIMGHIICGTINGMGKLGRNLKI